MKNNDELIIAGKKLSSRLFIGTGKFSSNKVMQAVIEKSETQVVTVALRRVDFNEDGFSMLKSIPNDCIIMPNTSGARNHEEAVRLARLARASGSSNWIKIEVINDSRYLLPDNEETVLATKILAAEGFNVLPYMSPDLYTAKKLEDAGAGAVMPLAAPIGSNKGITTKELLRIIINEIKLPIIVDAGLGKPSHACEALEMGAAAVLVNTALATAEDPVLMAEAFADAVKAGRKAYLAGAGMTSDFARASSPLTGFLDGYNVQS